jgi:hypothetical protein
MAMLNRVCEWKKIVTIYAADNHEDCLVSAAVLACRHEEQSWAEEV